MDLLGAEAFILIQRLICIQLHGSGMWKKKKEVEVIDQTNCPSYICSELLIYFLSPANKSVIFQIKGYYILQDTES